MLRKSPPLPSPLQDHPNLTYPTHPHTLRAKSSPVSQGRRWLFCSPSVPRTTSCCKNVNVLSSTGLLVLQGAGSHGVKAEPKMISVTFITYSWRLCQTQKEVLKECTLEKTLQAWGLLYRNLLLLCSSSPFSGH